MWCVIALVYTFFFAPETSGMSLEQMDLIFNQPFYKMCHPPQILRDSEEIIEGKHSFSIR